MSRLEELVRQLPPELHQEAQQMLEDMLAAHALDRLQGCLADPNPEMTSVEMQHELSRWRAERAVARHKHFDRDPSESKPRS